MNQSLRQRSERAGRAVGAGRASLNLTARRFVGADIAGAGGCNKRLLQSAVSLTLNVCIVAGRDARTAGYAGGASPTRESDAAGTRGCQQLRGTLRRASGSVGRQPPGKQSSVRTWHRRAALPAAVGTLGRCSGRLLKNTGDVTGSRRLHSFVATLWARVGGPQLLIARRSTSRTRHGSDSFAVGVGAGPDSWRKWHRPSSPVRSACTISSAGPRWDWRHWWAPTGGARTFVRELASQIPLPPDAKLTATARAVQVTGILMCAVNGNDLTRCQCFIDLALNDAKTRVNKILTAAMGPDRLDRVGYLPGQVQVGRPWPRAIEDRNSVTPFATRNAVHWSCQCGLKWLSARLLLPGVDRSMWGRGLS